MKIDNSNDAGEDDEKDDDEDDGWFKCKECAMKFLTKDLLEEHCVKHTGLQFF